jgi:hypothetical protein
MKKNSLSVCNRVKRTSVLKLEKITMSHVRVDRRIIGVEELESGVSFLKFFLGQFFYTKDHFFYKKNFFYKG